MANETAGRNDKLGNRYERNCIIKTILEVVDEKINSCSFECLGKDEVATDILIIDNDGNKTNIQCKERNASNDNWTFGDLKKYDLIKKWKIHLDSNEKTMVSLQTPITFIALTDLCKRAVNNNGDHKLFFENQIKNSSKTFVAFKSYCKSAGLNFENDNDIRIAMNYLSRTKVEHVPDETLKELILMYIRFLFMGNEEDIYNKFLDLVCNKDIMGHVIDRIFLNKFFKEKNIILNDLSNDSINFPTIERLNNDYKNSINLINNSYIKRSELDYCIDKINDGKSLLIHGKAGYGKSGLTHGLIDYFENNDYVYLAIKLDKKIPENSIKDWSEKLGFNTSFVACLNKFSENRKCVLILDQLDALRWTRNHNKGSIDVCFNIIDEIKNINLLRKEKISVILVCRTFDFENDSSINKLINSTKKDWDKVSVGLLQDSDVKCIVGNDFYKYSLKLKNMLKVPSNLFIWKMANIGDDYKSIRNIGDLIKRWWQEIERNAIEVGFNSGELSKAKNEIVNKMNNFGKISLSTIFLKDIDSNILDYLCSKELLILSDNSISFSHQSILDYYLVENMISDYMNGKSIDDLIGDRIKQTPNVRYQLQMFLEIMYDIDKDKFVEAIDYVINSKKIRSYLKYIAFDVLGLIPVVTKNIEDYILHNYKRIELFDDYINSVFMGHEKIISLLINNKVFEDCLNDGKTDLIVDLLRSISDNFTDVEVNFIKEQLFISEEMDKILYKCFPLEMIYDTDEMFELRLNLYEKYDDLLIDCYFNLDELIKKYEDRAIKMLVLLAKKFIFKKQHMKCTDLMFEYNEKIEIIDGIYVINNLLPLIPQSIEKCDIYEWENCRSYEKNVQRIIISVLKKAILNLIDNDCEKIFELFEPYFNKGFVVHNELILYSFSKMSFNYANRIMNYLFSDIDNNCFEYTSGLSSSISMTKDIVAKFIEYIDSETLSVVENKLLSYKPKEMVEDCKYYISIKKKDFRLSSNLSYWGDFQYEILEKIPDNLLTKKSFDLKKVLRRKYQSKYESKFKNNHCISGSVISPVAKKELSDKSWLSIIKNKKIINNRKSNYDKKTSTFVESSLYEFQSSLSVCVKKEPVRFINLFVDNCKEILSEYVYTLFDSLAYSECLNNVSNELLEKLFITFDYKQNDYKLAALICEIIHRKDDIYWSNNVINILKNIYNDIMNGNIKEEYIKHDDERDIASEFELVVINSFIGKFSKAIASILWNDDYVLEEFKDIVDEMMNSKDSYVRLSILYILHPILKYDFYWACDRIISLFDYIETYYYRSNFNILYCIFNKTEVYKEKIIDIIKYGIDIDSKNTKNVFATLIANLFLNFNILEDVITSSGIDVEVQNHFLEVFIDSLSNETVREKAKNQILNMVLVDNIKINSIRLFNSERLDLENDMDFIISLFKTPKASDCIEAFLHWIKKEGTNLVSYKNIIFDVIESAIEKYDKENPTHYYAYDDLNYIIIKLFDEINETNDDDDKNRCLDLWDKMFEKHIGSMRKLSKEIVDI